MNGALLFFRREFVIDCSCLARAREILSILLGGWILLELDDSESRGKMWFSCTIERKNKRYLEILILVR